jgi:hypothetical protein
VAEIGKRHVKLTVSATLCASIPPAPVVQVLPLVGV